ncbi:MAG: protein kinase domain-containing protein [Longimicrobiales bacterium]
MAIRVATMPLLQFLANDREIVSLHNRRRPAALLLYLAVERSATRDTLLGLLWPERRDEKGRHTLSQTLYELKQELGEDCFEARGDSLVARHDLTTDIAQFERAIETERFGEALASYQGGFLHGVHLAPTSGFENWVDGRRAHVARLHRRARREALAERVRAQDIRGAVELATRWAQLEPLDDEAHQRLIELLAQTGQRAEALRHFTFFEEVLRREELEPLPELLQLGAALRAGTLPVAPAAAEKQELARAKKADHPNEGLPADLEVVRLIGKGTVGRVYLAREKNLGRLVAVKVLAPESKLDSVLIRRFEREAKAAARIQHPNVAPIFRVGVLEDGTPFLVSPYVDGGSLEDRLAAQGPLPIADARRAIKQIASGLAAAHRLGIVHRDVRPANVLYDRLTGNVTLTDFGTAALIEAAERDDVALTLPGTVLGWPAYASPEQLQGEAVTERSDIYSLGVVGFELVSGRLPFEARTAVDLVLAHMKAEQRVLTDLRPETDKDLAELIGRCLNKRPEHRPFAIEVAQVAANS